MFYKSDMRFLILNLWHHWQQKQRLFADQEKNNWEQRQINMSQSPNVQLNIFLKKIRDMSAVNKLKSFKWLDSCSALPAPRINCCNWWLFVSRAWIRKQEDSGQAEASGERGRRLSECNAWDGRQIRFVHVWLKSQQGLVLFVETWLTYVRVTEMFGFGMDERSCFSRRRPLTCLCEFQGCKSKYLGQIVSS